MLILLTAMGVILLLLVLSKRHKKKQLQRMQLDILAALVLKLELPLCIIVNNYCMNNCRPGHYANLRTVNETRLSGELELEAKEATEDAFAGPNPYSEQLMAEKKLFHNYHRR